MCMNQHYNTYARMPKSNLASPNSNPNMEQAGLHQI